MPDLLLDHPTPNFDELVRVLTGEQLPRRVHLVEVGIDPEVLQTIQEACFGEPWALTEGTASYSSRPRSPFGVRNLGGNRGPPDSGPPPG